jgi:hypothetical protein
MALLDRLAAAQRPAESRLPADQALAALRTELTRQPDGVSLAWAASAQEAAEIAPRGPYVARAYMRYLRAEKEAARHTYLAQPTEASSLVFQVRLERELGARSVIASLLGHPR